MKTRITSVLGLGLLMLLLCRPSMAEEPATQPENVESLKQEIRRLKDELKKRDAEIENLKKRLSELDKKNAPETQPAADSADAEKYPQQWVTSFKMAEKNREVEIGKINAQIKANEQQLSNPKLSAHSRGMVKRQNEDLIKTREELRQAEVPPLPTLNELKTDYAGIILNDRIQVLQVISSNEVRAKFLIREKQIINDKETAEKWSKSVLFRGIETGSFAAGENGKLTGIFIVGKQETYIAGNMKRTEYVLESIDGSTWKTAYLRWKKEQGARSKK